MKLTLDSDAQTLTVTEGEDEQKLPLYSDEAFGHLSRWWVKVGWNQKYPYTFSWLGRPVIQLPEDLMRIQEVIHATRPDVIIETGVAHGGSLVFYASICHAMGHGRVVGVDIEIRPHNRTAIEAHVLARYITLVEGSSTDQATLERVRGEVRPGERVLVILDSNHSYAHVLAELEAYAPFVSLGSYIVATDGVMHDLADVPRGEAGWSSDNPMAAAEEFVATREDFVIQTPEWAFNESALREGVTHWPGAWVRRVE